MLPSLAFSTYAGSVYRNFATAHPSQELTDDLVADPRHQSLLKNLFYDRPPTPSPTERVLQKSAREIIQAEVSSKFKPENWYASRFSDGTWAVLYAAESETTALKEAMFHACAFYREELEKKEITVDRRVAELTVASDRCFDLLRAHDLDRIQLTSKDVSGYPYCQMLAKTAIARGGTLLRSPSARDPGGVCTPLFSPDVIREDRGHLKYLKCVLAKGKVMVFPQSHTLTF